MTVPRTEWNIVMCVGVENFRAKCLIELLLWCHGNTVTIDWSRHLLDNADSANRAVGHQPTQVVQIISIIKHALARKRSLSEANVLSVSGENDSEMFEWIGFMESWKRKWNQTNESKHNKTFEVVYISESHKKMEKTVIIKSWASMKKMLVDVWMDWVYVVWDDTFAKTSSLEHR